LKLQEEERRLQQDEDKTRREEKKTELQIKLKVLEDKEQTLQQRKLQQRVHLNPRNDSTSSIGAATSDNNDQEYLPPPSPTDMSAEDYDEVPPSYADYTMANSSRPADSSSSALEPTSEPLLDSKQLLRGLLQQNK